MQVILAKSAPHKRGVAAPLCPNESLIDPCGHCAARHLSVCDSLTEQGIRKLALLAETHVYRPGDALVREGDDAAHLFNITGGAVRVYKLLSDGRRQIVGFLAAGDFLGLASGSRYAFSAEAIDEVHACKFKKVAYRALLDEMPELERALLERASHELAAAQDQMLLLGRKTAVERLASFLISLSERARRETGDGSVVHLPMTRAEIADYLGLTTETVSRATSKLKTRGTIRLLSLHSVQINKPEDLKSLAGEFD